MLTNLQIFLKKRVVEIFNNLVKISLEILFLSKKNTEILILLFD